MRELMLIGVGRMGFPYVAAARRLGLGVTAVEAASRAAAIAGHVDELHVCTGERDELWVKAATAAVAGGTPGGVVAFSEPHVMAAALLQDRLDLPGPSLHAAVLSRNKALQRATFASRDVGQPEHLLVQSLADAVDWAARRLPVVVKPLSGAGSAGVELLADLDGYREAARRRCGEGPLLVETAVQGPEYSWEALVVDGDVRFANVTAKETTGPPNFVEVAHRTGIDLGSQLSARVTRFAGEVLAGLRMRTGLVHLEFRLAAAGPTLMEVAVRTPGDFLMDLLTLTYGADWFELVVRAAMSLPLPAVASEPIRFAAGYFPIAAPGVVTGVEGLAAVAAHPCVVDHALLLTEGDVVTTAESSTQRAGHVLLAADSPEELDAALHVVRETLVVRTAPLSTPRSGAAGAR